MVDSLHFKHSKKSKCMRNFVYRRDFVYFSLQLHLYFMIWLAA